MAYNCGAYLNKDHLFYVNGNFLSRGDLLWDKGIPLVHVIDFNCTPRICAMKLERRGQAKTRMFLQAPGGAYIASCSPSYCCTSKMRCISGHMELAGESQHIGEAPFQCLIYDVWRYPNRSKPTTALSSLGFSCRSFLCAVCSLTCTGGAPYFLDWLKWFYRAGTHIWSRCLSIFPANAENALSFYAPWMTKFCHAQQFKTDLIASVGQSPNSYLSIELSALPTILFNQNS